MRARLLVAIACSFLAGCAADFGGALGPELPTGNIVGYGRIAGSTRLGDPMNEKGPLVGMHLESRMEAEQGSRFQGGIMAGYGYGPAALGGWPIGFEGYLEGGTALRTTLFYKGDFYTGAAVSFPIRAERDRDIRQLNDSTWILHRRLELVPGARYRLFLDHPSGEPLTLRSELVVTFALRLRVFSDLF